MVWRYPQRLSAGGYSLVETPLLLVEHGQVTVAVGGFAEFNPSLEAGLGFVRLPQRHQPQSQEVVAPCLVRHDRQSPATQFDYFRRLARLMSDHAQHVQDVRMIRCASENFLIKRDRLRQPSGTMVIQRLPE